MTRSVRISGHFGELLQGRLGPQGPVALITLPCPVLAAADLLAMERLTPCAWDMGDPERLAYVVFTSGTSGNPMAVAHAHRAIWARGMMRAGWEGFEAGDRVLHAGAQRQ